MTSSRWAVSSACATCWMAMCAAPLTAFVFRRTLLQIDARRHNLALEFFVPTQQVEPFADRQIELLKYIGRSPSDRHVQDTAADERGGGHPRPVRIRYWSRPDGVGGAKVHLTYLIIY